MRTTLTIDDDLAALLKQRAPEFGLPFKQVVNQALRVGLGAQAKPRARAVPRTIPQAFAVPGRVADAPRPDKIAVVIAISDAGRRIRAWAKGGIQFIDSMKLVGSPLRYRGAMQAARLSLPEGEGRSSEARPGGALAAGCRSKSPPGRTHMIPRKRASKKRSSALGRHCRRR